MAPRGGLAGHPQALDDHEHDHCTVDFLDPATGITVRYGNGRWGRTPDKNYELRMAELNVKAFE
ncbi:hypothetical protein SCALM49S_07114 [Streptomyces californicus]